MATNEGQIINEDSSNGLPPLSSDFYLTSLPTKQKEKYLSKTITIPMKEDPEGAVVIDVLNDLPDDSNELCTVLQNEESDKSIWLKVAKSYANLGKIDESLNVIRQSLNSQNIMDSTSDVQASLHGFLSWLYLTNESNDSIIPLELAISENKTATSLDPASECNLLAQALLSFSSKTNKNKRTNFEKESRIFDNLLQSNSKNCYALMGKAKIFFYRENYAAALKLFQRCLVLNPLLRPDPRIGVGLCFWFLDRKDLANQAWTNSIQVNPDRNLEAKILISLSKFDDCFSNSGSDEEFKEKYLQAMEFTKASYMDDPSNDVILIILSSYYFAKENYELVERLCSSVTRKPEVAANSKSDALFWLARCKFFKKDFVAAQRLFSDSIKQNENNLLSRVGYGQCRIVRNELNDAIRTFEKIQESNPKILEVNYTLGMLYSKQVKHTKRTVEFLEKYVNLSKELNEPINLTALLTLSSVYEETDIQQSLKYLKMAKDQELKFGKPLTEISYSLLNNIGVFSLLKQDTEALSTFELALGALKEQNPADFESLSITLNYNIARCKESSKSADDSKSAMTIYEDILNKCPNYTSAKIRWLLLTCLSDDSLVKDEMSKLMDEFSDDLEVRSFYGWYLRQFGKKHNLTKNKDLESEHHRETLVNFTSHDTYALLSLANVYCSLARETRETAKKDQYYLRAAQLYQKALSIDPKNVYAAQGIAIIFADKKQTGLALEIFRKVRDSLQDISIYINLGHCLLEVKQFAKSIESYTLALTRFTNGEDFNLFNFISRAWLNRAIYEKNLDAFKTALEFEMKAYKLNPINSFKFNTAFIQFQIAEFIKKLPCAKRTMLDLDDCLSGLESGIKSLEEIVTSSSEGENDPSTIFRPPYPIEELKLRISMGNQLAKQLNIAIQDQKDYEIELETKFKQAKKLQEEESQKKLELQQKLEEERKLAELKLAEERKLLDEKAREWNQMRIEEEKDAMDQLDINEDDDNKPKKKRNGSAKSKKAKKNKKDFVVSEDESSAESSSFESGDESTQKKTKQRKRTKPESKEPAPKKRRLLQKKSSLSKETIDDSDSGLDADLFEDQKSEEEEEEEEAIADGDDDEDDEEAQVEDDAAGEDEEKEEGITRKKAKIVDDEDDDE